MKHFLALLVAFAFAYAADPVPAKEAPQPDAPVVKPGNPSGDPDAPAPTVDPTKNVPTPETAKPVTPAPTEKKKKKKV